MPYGIRFNLGGAPGTPHNVIDPTPGSKLRLISGITPGEVVPLESKGIALEDARNWAADPGCPLELVQLDRDGNEVPPTSNLTKAQLVDQAAELDPPLVLDERSQTKEQMLEAIAGHVPAVVQGADVDGNTAGDDTQDGEDD